MYAVLAAIPYTTFPNIELGPLTLRTFGLMVALGVLVGARLGGDYGERFGVNREDTYRTGTLMVLAGIIGSRLTWAATHTESIHNLVDVIAIWRGGIQFSGGFIAALLVGMPMFLKWSRAQRWNVLNGYALGLTAGVGIGRIGCYSVGEHFGRQTSFFAAVRYDGGDVREPLLGDTVLQKGMVFHNTALYEMVTMFALVAVMGVMIWRARRKGTEVVPGTLVALFLLWAGIVRFLLDTLRVNDERFASMTGAQWMSLVMVPYGLYVLFRVRPAVRKLVGADGKPLEEPVAVGLLDASDDAEPADGDKAAPDELAPPDNGDKADAEAGGDEDAEPVEVKADASDAGDGAEDTDEAEDQPVVAEADADAHANAADGETADEQPSEDEPVAAEASGNGDDAADGDDADAEPAASEASSDRGYLPGDVLADEAGGDVAAATTRD
jgi:phosphatidylglycerol---prolipoprotein diacylglyceryl transferase